MPLAQREQTQAVQRFGDKTCPGFFEYLTILAPGPLEQTLPVVTLCQQQRRLIGQRLFRELPQECTEPPGGAGIIALGHSGQAAEELPPGTPRARRPTRSEQAALGDGLIVFAVQVERLGSPGRRVIGQIMPGIIPNDLHQNLRRLRILLPGEVTLPQNRGHLGPVRCLRPRAKLDELGDGVAVLPKTIEAHRQAIPRRRGFGVITVRL